ncbi:MFS transporter [Sphingomonas sp.]|uniref:MFS transporter n=1 Tax=Sphingomonas sp. TaxID=28214 RepID=UPI000DB2BB46|nr:MFS transporter [Sphingomonas sp.]PZU09760.1 MAG: MFS transporter [Sphingomonas sp.]
MNPSRPSLQILLSVLCTALTYFMIGLPLAVLPQWVSSDMGFSAATAGLAISVQYVATIVSRGMVGPMVDTSGPRRAILIGLLCGAASGAILLAASRFAATPSLALTILFASRIALGFGESLVGTGAIAWGIGRTGSEHTARIISWNGIATYGAIAAGAPAGVLLFHLGGMTAVGLALAATGIAGVAFVWPQPATRTIQAERMPYAAVFARVLPYGAALGLGGIGFGVIGSFISLYYSDHGWPAAWIAISSFGVAFVLARLLFVGSIARHGGLAVALAFLAVETMGLMMIWLAGIPAVAALGSAIAGFGFALIFPALGMVVVDLVPPQNRGAAIGAYSMFTDIALCITGPAAGILAGSAGFTAPFLFGGVASLLGVGIVALLIQRASPSSRSLRF